MIVSFRDGQTRAVYDAEDTKVARKRLPPALWKIAQRKLDQMMRVTRLEQLGVPPGNRLETLRGDRAGQHSISINMQWRICFVWKDGAAESVEIVDYH